MGYGCGCDVDLGWWWRVVEWSGVGDGRERLGVHMQILTHFMVRQDSDTRNDMENQYRIDIPAHYAVVRIISISTSCPYTSPEPLVVRSNDNLLLQ